MDLRGRLGRDVTWRQFPDLRVPVNVLLENVNTGTDDSDT